MTDKTQLTLAEEFALFADLEDEDIATRPEIGDNADDWRWAQMQDWLDDCRYFDEYAHQ